MKKNHQITFALFAALSVAIISCGPNDDEGSMDSKNSNKEGAIDSTRIPNFDSTNAKDSSHASLTGQNALIRNAHLNMAEEKVALFKKEKGYFS